MTERFSKTVSIKAVDEEERTATGAVLVPDELDRQGDFMRPEAVRRFHSEQVDTGVMHAAFPDDAAELVRSEVLDTSEELGGATYPPGTWVASRRYEDDELWELVQDGVLTGFSIGGTIEEVAEHESVPNSVSVPDGVDEETAAGPVRELLDGTVDEVSDVDIPAVPRATYKGEDLGKSVLEQVDGEEEFVAIMTDQRGHDEPDARRLYQYLTDHAEKAAPACADTEKPFAGFEDWDDCIETMTEERGHSQEAAERICGSLKEEEEAAAPTGKVDINGTEVDLTLPERVINAAEAVEDNREAIPDSCGTGVGDRRVRQALGDGMGAEVIREVASYLHSHEEDVTADGPPTEWSEEEWSDCGNAQYAKWLFYADWFRAKVNEIDRARGEEETYPNVTNSESTADEGTDTESKDVDDPAFAVGDAVTWDWQGEPVHGRVADVGEQFTVSGNTITGEEGEAVYLIHDWDEEAEAYDVEGTAKPESSLSASQMDMPPVDEADTKAGLFARVKAALFGSGPGDAAASQTDDEATTSEALGSPAAGGSDETAAKAGRTLSQRNVEAAKAAYDAAADLLQQAEDAPDPMRYTDRPDDDFDIAEYGHTERAATAAAEGDTSATDTDDTMSDTTDEEPPAWADSLTKTVEQIEERVSELEDDVTDDEAATKSLEDAPEWAQGLAEKVDELDDRVETVATQTGGSDQLGKAEREPDETEKTGFTLDPRKAGN